MEQGAGVRRRATGQTYTTLSTHSSEFDADEHYVSTNSQVFASDRAHETCSDVERSNQRTDFQNKAESNRTNMIVLGVLTALAFLTRFYKINNPDEVVYVSTLRC